MDGGVRYGVGVLGIGWGYKVVWDGVKKYIIFCHILQLKQSQSFSQHWDSNPGSPILSGEYSNTDLTMAS